MKTKFAWAITVLGVGVAVYQSTKPQIERVITVTKEVPVEVERRVEVIREVEKEYSAEQLLCLRLGGKVSGSQMVGADPSDVLKNLRSLRVLVDIQDTISTDEMISQIKTNIELELRKVGVDVNENAVSPVLLIQMQGRFLDETTFTYIRELAVLSSAIIPTPDAWLMKSSTEIYSLCGFGRVGKSRVQELNDNYIPMFKEFLNDYLKANPVRM